MNTMDFYDNQKILAIIPARGGSKRLPNKNTIMLGGKSLICHSIDAAIKSNIFSEIMVTTDSVSIIEVCKEYTDLIIDDRPPGLAEDKTKVVDVIFEICNRAAIKEKYSSFAMLLPTAPFRRQKHFKKAIELFDKNSDTVVSLGPFNFPPQMALSIDPNNNKATPFIPNSPLITGNTRSQDQKIFYRPNGSMYFSKISSFLKNKSFFLGDMKGFDMSYFSSIDIDTKEDFMLAQALIELKLADSDFL